MRRSVVCICVQPKVRLHVCVYVPMHTCMHAYVCVHARTSSTRDEPQQHKLGYNNNNNNNNKRCLAQIYAYLSRCLYVHITIFTSLQAVDSVSICMCIFYVYLSMVCWWYLNEHKYACFKRVSTLQMSMLTSNQYAHFKRVCTLQMSMLTSNEFEQLKWVSTLQMSMHTSNEFEHWTIDRSIYLNHTYLNRKSPYIEFFVFY